MHASEEHSGEHRRKESKVLAHILAEFDLCDLFIGNQQGGLDRTPSAVAMSGAVVFAVICEVPVS